MKKIIYEALFLENPEILKSHFPPFHPNIFYHHATIAFKPKSLLMPEKLGEIFNIKIIGRLATKRIDALRVEFDGSQNDFPHITLSTAPGVQPSESNKEFKTEPVQVLMPPIFINARYGYFDGKNIIYEEIL